jgi:hypothetical protein
MVGDINTFVFGFIFGNLIKCVIKLGKINLKII